MLSLSCVLLSAAGAMAASASTSTAPVLSVSTAAPQSAGAPVLESFVSYSIEFSSFPDFAGNLSQPNTFSDNLLGVLASFQGSRPVIRVGGNTQDYATWNPNLTVALNGTFTPASADYPTIIQIGKPYFESFQTWHNTTYTYGFDMAIDNSTGQYTLAQTAPLACKALAGGRLAYYEMGNEPDLYKTSAQGVKRPSNWNEQDYVTQWQANTSTVQSLVNKACPGTPVKWYAPSFAGVKNSLDPVRVWQDGLGSKGNIGMITSHNYMGGATSPGITLQGTLMNHTNVVNVVAKQLNVSSLLAKYSLPFILGEHNSLYNEGAPGLSNSYGAALWGVDFNLYIAANGIVRSHMHQGTNYRYASWQPIDTSKATKGTKPPFYGNVAVAASLNNLAGNNVSVANLAFPDAANHPTDSAYAIYRNGALEKVAVINMQEYNYSVPNPGPRNSVQYSFNVPGAVDGQVQVKRLAANGSDAISGITFNGNSYNYELNNGKRVALKNVTTGEKASVSNGVVTVNVPYSGMALLIF